MERIGVHELRQNASRYLERVVLGEVFEITDRGPAVARLVPVSADPWVDLIASGKVTPADDRSNITDEGPADYGIRASATLAAMRANER
jgi:prevent-host-death family protein